MSNKLKNKEALIDHTNINQKINEQEVEFFNKIDAILKQE
jgi:hypothetical protein